MAPTGSIQKQTDVSTSLTATDKSSRAKTARVSAVRKILTKFKEDAYPEDPEVQDTAWTEETSNWYFQIGSKRMPFPLAQDAEDDDDDDGGI